MTETRPYILCTVVRNEQQHLPTLIEDVAGQSFRPALWLIVNDFSEDRTGEILDDASERHQWLEVMDYPGCRSRNIALHLARLKSFATEMALELAEQRNID